MTTTAGTPRGAHPTRTPRVLAVAAAGLVGAVGVAAAVAAAVAGSPAVLGILLGGAISLVFFVFGSGAVMLVTWTAPQASLPVALMTFTLQVVLVAAVISVLASSSLVGTTVSAGALTIGLIVAAVAWMVGHLVGHARLRVPVYDVQLPGQVPSSGREGEQRDPH